jgi:hypothetical protein
MMMGRTPSRDSECDLRRGVEAAGGSPTSLREGERPRCGLKKEIKSAHLKLGRGVVARAQKTLYIPWLRAVQNYFLRYLYLC